jgi:hypothetical protein
MRGWMSKDLCGLDGLCDLLVKSFSSLKVYLSKFRAIEIAGDVPVHGESSDMFWQRESEASELPAKHMQLFFCGLKKKREFRQTGFCKVKCGKNGILTDVFH